MAEAILNGSEWRRDEALQCQPSQAKIDQAHGIPNPRAKWRCVIRSVPAVAFRMATPR